MIVYRIGQRQRIEDLTGQGAFLYGGRWNNKGQAMLYTTTGVSLAVLEVTVNMLVKQIPKNYSLITLSIPDDPLLIVDRNTLPSVWRDMPVNPITREMGDAFLADNIHLGMLVPSAVVPMENNILLNPAHPDFRKVEIKEIQPFEFDKRLFK